MFSIKNIFTFIASVFVAVFLVYGTFANHTKWSQTNIAADGIEYTVVRLETDSNKKNNLAIAPYDGKNVPAWSVLGANFWRLATAFALPDPVPTFIQKNNHIIFDKFRGIFSFYDPFVKYSLEPKNNAYKIHQITNGSVHITTEKSGVISVYSIDAVVQLDFYHQWQKMTDMILFPGMFIRFDPDDNKLLKGAKDLYRIMAVLTAKNTTGIEFIDPRVTNNNKENIFLVYRSAVETRPLFNMVHWLFLDRVATADMIKNYRSSLEWSDNKENIKYVYNPNKLNFYQMNRLRVILSDAVQSQDISIEKFHADVKSVYASSRKLIEKDTIRAMLEQFLTDARFASFGGIAGQQFESIYNEIANILGIAPDLWKGKFFQALSDIYSRNIAKKKDDSISPMHTYTQTAMALQQTLENTRIDPKDFFNITLYAYQILEKAQDKTMFTKDRIGSPATYVLINTLFRASEKYIAWLESQQEKNRTYRTMVSQFYSNVLSSLVRSLYHIYTTTNQNNVIVLKGQYLNGDQVQNLPLWLGTQLSGMLTFANDNYKTVLWVYAQSNQGDIKQYDINKLNTLYQSLLRLNWFLQLTTSDKYRTYLQNPFVAEESENTDDILPKITNNTLETYNQPEVTQE